MQTCVKASVKLRK